MRHENLEHRVDKGLPYIKKKFQLGVHTLHKHFEKFIVPHSGVIEWIPLP